MQREKTDEAKEELRAEFLAKISEKSPFADTELDLEKAGVNKYRLAKREEYRYWLFPVNYCMPFPGWGEAAKEPQKGRRAEVLCWSNPL
jgi:hypothetical protein